MKIAFDQQVFLLQEYGGISRYICSLAAQLSLMSDVEARIFAPIHFNRNLATLKSEHGTGYFLPKANPKIFRLILLTGKYLSRMSVDSFKPDIFHETYYSFDKYCPPGAKRILTVYDLIHERFPETFERSYLTSGPKKAAAQRADHVICISESTRRDLVEICDIPEDKTSVTYLGVDFEFTQSVHPSIERIGSPRPYFLYVGARSGYKNFGRFIKAFSRSSRIKSEFDIVCFGGGALRPEELSFAKDSGIRPEQIIHLGGDDDRLASVYKQAFAFVYPSLYEGFGIPPLEAMAMGCPVICSNSSSLPEVVGAAGEYFDPNDEESIIAAMEKVLLSPTRREELVSHGREQVCKFSWERCANETLDIYRRLL